MNRKVLFAVLLIGVLAVSAFAVAAQDDHVLVPTENGLVMIISDGRLNGTDISAPVAVYYTFDFDTDTTGNTFRTPNGIQLLEISPVTSNGQPLAEVTADDLRQLINSESHMMDFDGYTLNYSPDTNWFWVSAPADFEGKVYTFQWENTLLPVTPSTSGFVANDATDDTSASAAATAEPVASDTP